MGKFRVGRVLRIGVLVGALAVAAIALAGFVVMSLWNWLMPALFAWPAIGFWQALGLLVLSKVLFGGFRGARFRGHWRGRMAERWERMTPEEREKFREAMRQRCGGRFGQDPTQGPPGPVAGS